MWCIPHQQSLYSVDMNRSTLVLCLAVAFIAVHVVPSEGVECPQLMCLIGCTHGYQVDAQGCEVCRCVDGDASLGSFMKVSLSEVLSKKIETKAQQ